MLAWRSQQLEKKKLKRAESTKSEVGMVSSSFLVRAYTSRENKRTRTFNLSMSSTHLMEQDDTKNDWSYIVTRKVTLASIIRTCEQDGDSKSPEERKKSHNLALWWWQGDECLARLGGLWHTWPLRIYHEKMCNNGLMSLDRENTQSKKLLGQKDLRVECPRQAQVT